jgi:DNA-binding NarL/FixJ family response regulator
MSSTNKEASAQGALDLSRLTVKYHLANIYRKPRVANRTEPARCASQRGLVKSPFYEGDNETA